MIHAAQIVTSFSHHAIVDHSLVHRRAASRQQAAYLVLAYSLAAITRFHAVNIWQFAVC